jgi:hypothetical protein
LEQARRTLSLISYGYFLDPAGGASMARAFLIVVSCVFATLACGDDSNDSAGGAAGSGGQACPDLSGKWTVSNHCTSLLVGMEVIVTQNGCDVVTSGSFPNYTGKVQSDGKFTVSGTSAGVSVACAGTSTAHQLTLACTGNCNVTLSR